MIVVWDLWIFFGFCTLVGGLLGFAGWGKLIYIFFGG